MYVYTYTQTEQLATRQIFEGKTVRLCPQIFTVCVDVRRCYHSATSPLTLFHSCQPTEFVIPNGGGFGKGTCPLKLKKMVHMHRNGKRIVACSACTVAQNQRTLVNVDCSRTYCVVYGTRGRKKITYLKNRKFAF